VHELAKINGKTIDKLVANLRLPTIAMVDGKFYLTADSKDDSIAVREEVVGISTYSITDELLCLMFQCLKVSWS
jgi:hypothetical protein